jgi:lipid biosynthesis B12-binding/radical SAM protein
MRVLMVSSNTAVSPYPLYPLGLSMVAAALARAGHEVRQFDYLQKDSSLSALAREVEGFRPGLVGVSVRNIDNVNSMSEKRYIQAVREIVAGIREASGSKVVLGGAGFSLMPEPILDETGADFGIAGEGEALMVDFTNNAEKGVFPAERVLGPERKLSGAGIPSARYDEEIMGFYLRSGNIASVQTKRGCRHRCVYCSYPLLEGRRIRRRDPARVVDDMELLRERHGVKYVFFIDSVFNDSEGAYLEVLNEMKRRGVSVAWTAFFRPTGLDDDVVGLMKETGLVSAEIGADAACDTTLKGMGKGFTFLDVRKCNELFMGQGIATANFYMFGGPGETRETVLEGIGNIKSLGRSVHFIYQGVRILPDTALAGLALRENLISRGQGLLEPAYYFSPGVERDWLEETLTGAFQAERLCIYPPDSMDDKLRLLHGMGYSGPIWEMLLSAKKVFRKGVAGGP